MGWRTSWVTGRPDRSRLVDRVQALGGVLLARSSHQPEPWDHDELGDLDGELFSVAGVEIDHDALLRALDHAIALVDPGHALVIDLTRRRPEVRLLPSRGPHRVIVRSGAATRRFAAGQEPAARRLARELLQRRSLS